MDLHTDQFTLVHRPDTGIGLDSLSCPLFTHIYQETSCIYLTFDPKKNKKKDKKTFEAPTCTRVGYGGKPGRLELTLILLDLFYC